MVHVNYFFLTLKEIYVREHEERKMYRTRNEETGRTFMCSVRPKARMFLTETRFEDLAYMN
jgi:hypothetical protein